MTRYRHRHASPSLLRAERFGITVGEAGHLRAATVRIIDRLSDRQLEVSGQPIWSFLVERGAVLGVEPGNQPKHSADYPPALRDLARDMRALGVRRVRTPLDRRLAWLAGVLALDAVEVAVLGVFARCAIFDTWRSLLGAIPFRTSSMTPSVLALFTGAGAVAIEDRLLGAGTLVRSGLVGDDGDGEYAAGGFLTRVARAEATDPTVLAQRMTPAAPPSTLRWDDFAHLPARDLASDLLAANAPVSILLHGAPGTGKTEFARALADRLGRTALFAGLTDDEGGEPDRGERLAHLAILRALTRGDASRVIVVDEADDVLRLAEGRGGERRGSKLWLNRLVELPETPTIWIANDPGDLGATIVRRMHLAIRFDLPPERVRARVVARAAEARGLALAPDAVARIAALPAPPAVLANAVGTAALTGGSGEQAVTAGTGILDALGTRVPRPAAPTAAYDPALAQADHALGLLADRLAAAPERGWSLLLAGPPGTGKSAWARHLAARLGIEVEERRGSDLLGAFVGETEANIARAFRDCGERGAMLLIDEADSFLFDRRGAERSWESGMVNEMLRWMEDMPAPFVATTNLDTVLDPATQRRFTLTVRFRALTPARAAALFERRFGMPLPPGTEPLDGVTPGDVAVVARRATLLGEAAPARLLAWIRAEVDARGGRTAHTGFHRAAPEPLLREPG